MATDELHHQWSRTERFLLDSKALLPSAALVACASDLEQFDEFIEHNELGLAAQWLTSIVQEFKESSIDAMRLLSLAEASMGRLKQQQSIDLWLSQLLGHTHETTLPPAA